MKKTFVILSVLAAVMVMFTAPACVEASEGAPKTVKYTLISETWANEPRVTAIAIEYDKPLQIAYDLTSHFEVYAELLELTDWTGAAHPLTKRPKAPRHITKAYTSNRKEPGQIWEGNYVILELNVEDDNATSVFITTEKPMPVTNSGWMVLPYEERMVYEIKQLYELKYNPQPVTSGLSETTGTNIVFERVDEYPILVADEFVPHTYNYKGTPIEIQLANGPKTINTLGYTMYSPPVVEPGKEYPLVMFFHGSSCRPTYVGTDVDARAALDVKKPVLATEGPTTWVKRGSTDCYVVAPQYQIETVPIVKELFLSLLADPSLQIDEDRIYVSGLSMGGRTSWNFLRDDNIGPMIDGAVISCAQQFYAGSPNMTEDDALIAKVNAIGKAPYNAAIWLTHADLDPGSSVSGARMSYQALMGTIDTATEAAAVENLPLPFAPDASLHKQSFYEDTMPNGKTLRYSEIHADPHGRNTELHIYSPDVHEHYEWTYWNPEIPAWLFQQHN